MINPNNPIINIRKQFTLYILPTDFLMKTQDIAERRKRRHKSDSFVSNKTQIRSIRPKRLTAMNTAEYLTMEESKISIVTLCIEEIIVNVFQEINKAKITSQLCLKQVQKKTELLKFFDLYNMESQYDQHAHIITLEPEPKFQPKYKVILNKDKNTQNLQIENKKEIPVDQHKTNDLSHQKSTFKIQKLHSSSHFAGKAQSNSMKSLKTNRGNSSMMVGLKNNQYMNEQMSERSKEKQRKRKQEIIKKLLQQYQQKLKQISHPGPQPIMQQYRAFFTHPETREQQDFRTSFLYLRQLKQSQQNLKSGKLIKKTLSKPLFAENGSKQNLDLKLPVIFSPMNSNRSKNPPVLFAQDQNGAIINVKHTQHMDSLTRQHSLTMHEGIIKRLHESKLKQISGNMKQKIQQIPNPKVKPQSQLINQNSSIVSTLCQSVNQDILERSILEKGPRNGVTLKRSKSSNRASGQTEGLKFPAIYMKK